MIFDPSVESLLQACQRLAPIHSNYANLPIEEGFNWTSCLGGVPFTPLYLVVFRSIRRASADLELLLEYDDLAYEAAREVGGLLTYFKGQANQRRECLSFCLWESKEQARKAAGGSSHQLAAEITARMYEAYDLERYQLSGTVGGGIDFERITADSERGRPVTA